MADGAGSLRVIPTAFEAEAHILGEILLDNRRYGEVAGRLATLHFADDRHAKIYEAIGKLIERGRQASATTLRTYFEQDESLKDVGGAQYLSRLMAIATRVLDMKGAAGQVVGAWLRRQYIDRADALIARACDVSIDVSAEQIGLDAISEFEALATNGGSTLITARQVRERIVRDLNRELPRYSTGFQCIDDGMAGGLFAEKAYGILARFKQGKTVLGGQISNRLNRAGVRHAYIAAEMGPIQIEQRQMATELGINALAFLDDRRGRDMFVAAAGEKAIQTPENTLYLDAAGLTFDRLRREVISCFLSENCAGFILDYLQLVGGARKGITSAQHFEEVCQWIADTCRKRKKWALVLGQINQEGNVRHGEGIKLAFDWVAELKRDLGGEGTGAWLEMLATRYTRWGNVGSELSPALTLNTSVGPHFTENQAAG